MRKTLNILGWVSVFLTILALIFTILTSYHFKYINKYFDGYYALQWCLFATLLIWGIRLFNLKANIRNTIYSVICILMAAGTMVFMYMKVN